MAKSQIVQIEACAPRNRQVIFKPIGSAIRGRVDFSDCRNQTEQLMRRFYPQPVPGQRICIDFATGQKWIAEPLYLDEHESLRAEILQRGYKLPPKRVDYESESLVTWCYHAHRLIESGLARIVEGELPNWEDFTETPRKRFISHETKSDEAKLADVHNALLKSIDANTAMLQQLIERIPGSRPTSTK